MMKYLLLNKQGIILKETRANTLNEAMLSFNVVYEGYSIVLVVAVAMNTKVDWVVQT